MNAPEELWQQDAREFYPYSSKYDAYLAHKTELSEQERRGLKLFEDPAKGNCARCHISTQGKDGTPPQFTEFVRDEVARWKSMIQEVGATAD